MQETKQTQRCGTPRPCSCWRRLQPRWQCCLCCCWGRAALPAQPVLEHVYDSAQTIQQEGLYPEYFGFKLFQMDNYTDHHHAV